MHTTEADFLFIIIVRACVQIGLLDRQNVLLQNLNLEWWTHKREQSLNACVDGPKFRCYFLFAFVFLFYFLADLLFFLFLFWKETKHTDQRQLLSQEPTTSGSLYKQLCQ